MDNVVLIETAWGDQDIAIQIERTAEMTTAARELSDCIKGLPLTAEQNNTLVPLIVKQVQEAERGAFPCLPGLWTALPFCVIFQTGHAGCTRTPRRHLLRFFRYQLRHGKRLVEDLGRILR